MVNWKLWLLVYSTRAVIVWVWGGMELERKLQELSVSQQTWRLLKQFDFSSQGTMQALHKTGKFLKA